MPAARRPRRRCTAVLAVTSLAWGQACASYRPPRAIPLSPGSSTRVQSAAGAAFPVLSVSSGVPGEPLCRATLVEGVVTAVSGDTLTFGKLTRLRSADPVHDGRCVARGQPAVVVRQDGAQLAVERVDWGRTAIAVLVPAAVLVGLAAWAASMAVPSY